MNKHDNTAVDSHTALPVHCTQTGLIEQVLTDVRELRREFKDDRRELWSAMNSLRESITGNNREGLVVRVDRNTNFRRTLTKLLWALFTPLYGGLIVLLLKTLFFN